jgi:hypothetical protein
MHRFGFTLGVTVLATLLAASACSKPEVVVHDLDKLGEQGPGVATPDEMVTAIKTAATKKNLPALQALVYAKGLNKNEVIGMNALFLSMTNTPIESVDFIDDLAVLKNPGYGEWRFYLFNPAKHQKLVDERTAYLEKLAAVDPADKKTEIKPPVDMIEAPEPPEVPGTPTVRPVGLVRVAMKGLGKKTTMSNELYFLIGKPEKGETLYLGTITYMIPPEPTDSTENVNATQ